MPNGGVADASNQTDPTTRRNRSSPDWRTAATGGATDGFRMLEVVTEVWLVIAGGLIGFFGSLIPVILQRRWASQDRRRATDAKALEAAVHKLMAWQDYAMKAIGSGETASARDRLIELDRAWEADLSLIPDQEATQELLTLSREIFFAPGWYRDAPDAMSVWTA